MGGTAVQEYGGVERRTSGVVDRRHAGTVDRGRTLHREFVGMLFALAIAEAASRSGAIVNSGLSWRTTAPAVAHLALATMVVATSWVGWGWSKHSLSNITHVFTRDFIELVTDVWLVAVYFFIVHGAESIAVGKIASSASTESFWITVMFGTYLGWDVLTKVSEPRVFLQRAWGTTLCLALSAVTYYVAGSLWAPRQVVWADLSLLALVFLFRATKLKDFKEHSRLTWSLIAALTGLWGGALIQAS